MNHLDELKHFKEMPRSYWMASAVSDEYPALSEDIKVDVLIIGGGITGITCGLLLKKENLNVAIIEADRIARGTTGHTTAKITSLHNLIYDKIKTQISEELAKQYAEANERAIKEIKSLIDTYQIDCDYLPQSAYTYTERDENINKITNEVKTAASLGIKAEYVTEIQLPFTIKAAVRFDDQAQFHPLKYVFSLAREYKKLGGQLYEKTRAAEIEEGESYVVITDSGKKITAERVIIASHYPFYNKHGMYFSKIYAEKSYVAAVCSRDKYPGGMYINAEEPVHSFRSQQYEDSDLILIGGGKHKTGQSTDTAQHYKDLIDYGNSYFTIETLPYRWSTQDCMTLDGLPYVGNFTENTPNLYVATGFGKWGMTNSMASSMLLRDLIIKGESPWQDAYNPARRTLGASAVNFIVENINVAENLIGGKIKSIPKIENVEIKSGEAMIVEVNGKRAGAFRDEEDVLYVVNTTCTHMGCELNWNSAERSWDCPCHGSRFAYDGSIIEGPANCSLSMENDVNTIKKLLTEDF